MSASLKLFVLIVLLFVVPLFAESNIEEIDPVKNKSNFKRLLRFFGIGAPVNGNHLPQQFVQNQFNPCGLPFTTTPAPLGPLCPYPLNPHPNLPIPLPHQQNPNPALIEDPNKNFQPLRPLPVENPGPIIPAKPIAVPIDPLRPLNPVLVNPSGPHPPFRPVLVDPVRPSNPTIPVLVDPVKPQIPEPPRPVEPVSPPRPVEPVLPPIRLSTPPPDNVGQGTSPAINVGPPPNFPVFGPPQPIPKPFPAPWEGNPPPNPENPHNVRPLPCSALRKFIPSGFGPASATYYSDVQCQQPNPFLRNEPPCSSLDTLGRLGATIMRSLIISSELDLFLSQTHHHTIFAPLDIAFKRLPIWFMKSLQTDKKLRKSFVLNHIVKEDAPLRNMGNEYLVQTARPGATRVRINTYFPESELKIYTVDGSRILRGDILTLNGRVHLTDKVIMPNPPRNAAEYLSEKIEFENFWNIVKNSKLEIFQSDHPITVLIPINEAVDRLDIQSLKKDVEKLHHFVDHHVLNGTLYGSGLINNEFAMTNFEKEIKLGVASDGFAKHLTQINGYINILKSDIPLVNGVAHIIDRCISEKVPFYVYDESDEFAAEYGVISKRNMKVTGEEKQLSF